MKSRANSGRTVEVLIETAEHVLGRVPMENDMEWKYIKELQSETLINDFELQSGYNFCTEFRECIIANNGGRPTKNVFDTEKTKGRTMKSLLSYNKSDRENIWHTSVWNINRRYIPFGVDNFGNLLCFDKDTDKVIFVNHENMEIEYVADNFGVFLEMLRGE